MLPSLYCLMENLGGAIMPMKGHCSLTNSPLQDRHEKAASSVIRLTDIKKTEYVVVHCSQKSSGNISCQTAGDLRL